MNKTNLISLISLLAMVIVLPAYALRESQRLQQAQADLRQKDLTAAYGAYTVYCSDCHGVDGGGLDMMPALNNPALAQADPEILFKTIARASHSTTMAAWHIEEGGILSTYQVNQLVTLIRFGDWSQVELLAASIEDTSPRAPFQDMVAVFQDGIADVNHQCYACHEEPKLHTGLFGLQCARCHTIQSWTPAYLTRHTFFLDHGGKGTLACQTCHPARYPEYTCYSCHDHQPDDMQFVHQAEGIAVLDGCATCHPTGQSGEAEQLNAPHAQGMPSMTAQPQALR